jgi:hypothetical protein
MTQRTKHVTLPAFEKWVAIIQTVIFLATLFVALCIGLKQTKISSQQADISKKQSDISEALLDLQYAVSVEVAYDPATKHLNITNKGQCNVYLWGDKLGEADKTVEQQPRLITPGGLYYIIADGFESLLLTRIGQNGETSAPFEVYLTSQRGSRYVVHVLLFIQIKNGIVSIHPQTTAIEKTNW